MAKGFKKLARSQLAVPLFALFLLIVFNVIRDIGFFSLAITNNNDGNAVLSGNIISILNGASELAILAIGMHIGCCIQDPTYDRVINTVFRRALDSILDQRRRNAYC